jgi:two-component system, NarL family, response regulator LiaR
MERIMDVAVHDERTRVARELHDTVAQTLYSISLGASRVLTLLERNETAHLQDIVEDLLHQANVGQTELRALLYNVRSDDKYQLRGRFTGALASLATGLEARAGCQVRLSLADEPDIAPATKATLVRIVREALHNIAKHARATLVDLVLEVGPAEVMLLVADDGGGFDPSEAYPGHFGLQLMREHAMVIGGTLEVVSAPGRGTQVRVRVTRRRDNGRIRILIADDHEIVRQGLRAFLDLDSALEVVGEAANGAEAVRVAHRLRPDVVLMDLVMPELDGIAATEVIRRELPDTNVVVLTSVLEDASVVGAVRAGAVGYLLKDTGAPDLRQAIKAAAAGQVQISPRAATRLVRKVVAPERLDALSQREVEVLRLLARGSANKQIARGLGIAEKTVKTHVSSILGKLGVQSRTQAALYAGRVGLVPLAELGDADNNGKAQPRAA